MGMLDLEDLGLEPEQITVVDTSAPEPVFTPLALTPDSPLARTLYEVWSGCPVTVVKAAPGSGKSTLITRLVSLLLIRTDLEVAILTPTRGAAFDLAERVGAALAENCGPREKFQCVFGVSRPEEFDLVQSVAPRLGGGGARTVLVRTVASASGIRNPIDVDVVIVDEAYQVTMSDMAVALRDADQVVLVGDPGQIGPVVTVTTRCGRGSRPPRPGVPGDAGRASGCGGGRAGHHLPAGSGVDRAVEPAVRLPGPLRPVAPARQVRPCA